MKATLPSSVSGRPFGLSPSPIPTAGYVSDGQVARGGATGFEKTKGARENDREPERGKREGYRSGGRKGWSILSSARRRTFLFIRVK